MSSAALAAELSSQFRRIADMTKALQSCDAIFWAADLDGTVLLSEGAGLHGLGLDAGDAVGHRVSHWPQFPFDRALVRLSSGSPSVRFITEDRDDVWLNVFSYLLSPAGRPAGIVCIATKITGAVVSYDAQGCLLGSCMVRTPT